MISNFIDSYMVLAPHECERIIQYFHDDDRRVQGEVVGDHTVKDVKQSTDVYISFGCRHENDADDKYNDIILPAVKFAVNSWVENHRFLITMPSFRTYESYNIQHYKDGEGYFGLHC